MNPPRRSPALVLTALLGAALVAHTADPDPAKQARELYDRGKYEQARVLLERLAAAGAADGPLLYRLAYTQRLAADPVADETQRRAIERLEQEAAAGADLETDFYLFSALRNVARLSEAKEVGARAVARLEAGELEPPPTGEGAFWVGRLYDELERDEEAARWYERSIETFRTAGVRDHVYRTMALRALVTRALAAGDTERAGLLLGELGPEADLPFAQLEQLAEQLGRSRSYQAAREVWRTIERRYPGQAGHARYMWSLSGAAVSQGGLPEQSPSGKRWAEMSREELAAGLSELVQAVRDAQAEWLAAEQATPELRAALEARIEAARAPFTAAAFEFGQRRYGIREAAFTGGYAPMVFHDAAWQLPERPEADESEPAAGAGGATSPDPPGDR